MLTGRKLITRYVLKGAIPYVLLSLVLLTGILFTQQSTRFAELALYADVPLSLAGEIAAALLPSVLILTLPVAVLAGIVIGFARMGSDSEIIAIRAAGVGTWSLLWPALLIGVLASGATAYLHFREAPQAARDLRRAALQGALRKLESPVEPRNFNTEIPGYVIYVRDGDKSQGVWGRVFIYAQQADGGSRIVTARSGRIDSSGEKSELVLSDAVALKIPSAQAQHPGIDPRAYVVERLAQLRFAIDTGRAELVERLTQKDVQAEELDWDDLKRQAASSSIDERREAERTIQRRLSLAAAPFVFSLFGGLLGMRVRRGGRGAGILLALGVIIVYYLLSLLGESLVRSNSLSALSGEWLGNIAIILFSLFLLRVDAMPRFGFRKSLAQVSGPADHEFKPTTAEHTLGVGRSGFPSLLDTSLFSTLASSFVIGFISLVSIFIIFTLFEIWRLIATNHIPLGIVARYLIFLLPLVAVELFPATMLITVLITYALLARRSEAIAWWASGQSVYRLMIPGLLFAIAIGAGSWLVQEHVMPAANVKQDALRARIRGGQPRAVTRTGRQWLASPDSRRLYSYEFDEQQGTLSDPTIYELDDEGVHLSRVTSGKQAYWTAPNQLSIKDSQLIRLGGTAGMTVEREIAGEVRLDAVEPPQVFRPTIDKPSQLSVVALSSYLRAAKTRGVDVSALALALQRKYVNPFSVVVMAFIGMPLALAFGRRGALVAMCVAVGVSVAYWGVGGGFQQLGNHGLLPPEVAAWAPPVIFAAAGVYFLSRVRT